MEHAVTPARPVTPKCQSRSRNSGYMSCVPCDAKFIPVMSATMYRKIFLYIVALMTGMNFASHGTQDMYPLFLERDWHFGVTGRAGVTACSMVGAIIGGTLVGWISDKVGRRRAMIGSLLLATAVVPLWAFAPSLPLLVLGAFLLQFFVQGAWGVIPAHLSELSPDSVRGFLPGFGYQCGVFF